MLSQLFEKETFSERLNGNVEPPIFLMPDLSSEKPAETPSLYQEFLAERDEILKYKWIKSEEAGHDVGLETALVKWSQTQREGWKKEYQSRSRY